MTEVSAQVLPSSSPKLFRNIKGIILDFDGTLFDSGMFAFRVITANPLELLRVWRERLVRKRFAGYDYSSPEKYYRAFFAILGKACSRSPQRMRCWYYNRYMPRMVRVLKRHYKPRPGVAELLRRYSADGPASGALPKIAIYSDYPFLAQRLEALGLSPGAIPLYCPEYFGAQKPAARPFTSIAESFGLVPEEILVVGDREDTDGLGAFRAGMRFFCLETGRKRYYRLDPNRQRVKEEPHGPLLLMYAGAWNDLYSLLVKHFFN